jgi:hypothetical protein
MLLGSLAKNQQRLKQIRPYLRSPYNGYSVKEVIDKLSDIREPSWVLFEKKRMNMPVYPHSCTVKDKMKEPLDQVKKEIRGLELFDLKQKRTLGI